MLKISEPSWNHAAVLKAEGHLVGPWVAELDAACARHLESKQPLALDVSDVLFADRAGLALLLRLRSGGVTLLDVSPFLAEELRITAS
jgi:ABC-type transporter Mla MlaB component